LDLGPDLAFSFPENSMEINATLKKHLLFYGRPFIKAAE